MIISEFSKLFHTLKDPVVAVHNNKIVYFNPAAEMQLGDALNQPPSSILVSEGVLTINGAEYNVTSSNAFDHHIYFLSPAIPRSAAEEILQQISSRLKDKVAELKLTSRMMTPHIENNADEKTIAYSRAVAKISTVLHRMVGNLGFFQSFDSVSFFPTTFNISQCIGDIVDSVPVFVGENCPSIIFECGNSDMTIQADREKIELALYQILSNSLKHTPKDGKIIIKLSINNGNMTLAVTDNGCGLKPEQLNDLWSIGNAGFSPTSGVGVGLPMVQHIAQLHGGQALLTSGSNGTSVTLSIPTVQPNADDLNSLAARYDSGLSDMMLQLSDVIPPENFCSKFMD